MTGKDLTLTFRIEQGDCEGNPWLSPFPYLAPPPTYREQRSPLPQAFSPKHYDVGSGHMPFDRVRPTEAVWQEQRSSGTISFLATANGSLTSATRTCSPDWWRCSTQSEQQPHVGDSTTSSTAALPTCEQVPARRVLGAEAAAPIVDRSVGVALAQVGSLELSAAAARPGEPTKFVEGETTCRSWTLRGAPAADRCSRPC